MIRRPLHAPVRPGVLIVLLVGISFAIPLASGCKSQPSLELQCGTGESGLLDAQTPVEVRSSDSKDLRAAAVALDAKNTASWQVAIACAEVSPVASQPEAWIELGVPVEFAPSLASSSDGAVLPVAAAVSPRPMRVTLPWKAARLPRGAEPRHVRIAARTTGGVLFFPPVTDVEYDLRDAYRSTISFSTDFFATYQAVAAADAGTPVKRRYTYKALLGISMGGNAAMSIGLRHHERFDMIADLGGEPGPSMRYSLGAIRDYILGRDCAADPDAPAQPPRSIPARCADRSPQVDQFEIPSHYDEMVYQEGEGVGLKLRRKFYAMALRDMARAFGNLAVSNVEHPYAPPGVDPAFFALEPESRCDNPLVLQDYFDARWNPGAEHAVITYCDGGDSEEKGYGVWDPNGEHLEPMEILLAVDVNGNGRRDGGEPLIVHMHEPFRDVGIDGLYDADEPGYDAVTNPDPAGDNYHYLRNPRGTEGNYWYDPGEPYDDFGVDGVSGTCQQGATPPAGISRCYDLGEGDGVWTVSPSVQGWLANDLRENLAQMTAAERARIDFWFDAGIRDFFNAALAANAGFSDLMTYFGAAGTAFTGFPKLTGAPSEQAFDFTSIDWSRIGRNVYMRYGSIDADDALIALGDGRHIGTVVQAIHRMTTAVAWISQRWPNGDRDEELRSGLYFKDLTFTTQNGRETPFGLFLPPGYDAPENQNRRYPVLVFLHGYGMQPRDMVDLSAVFETYMQSSGLPITQQFQKMIFVYADGRCRPNKDGVPVDPSGDRCESGNFYMNAPGGGPAQLEDALLELLDHIDANYRTKPPEDVEIVP